MSDLRKKNGGPRPGAGRKPARIEQNVRAAIMAAMKKDKKAMIKVWEKVFEKAQAGSDKHIQILLNYYYGRPTEHVEINTKQLVLKRMVIDVNGNTGA